MMMTPDLLLIMLRLLSLPLFVAESASSSSCHSCFNKSANWPASTRDAEISAAQCRNVITHSDKFGFGGTFAHTFSWNSILLGTLLFGISKQKCMSKSSTEAELIL
jgi:hypothetical protein